MWHWERLVSLILFVYSCVTANVLCLCWGVLKHAVCILEVCILTLRWRITQCCRCLWCICCGKAALPFMLVSQMWVGSGLDSNWCVPCRIQMLDAVRYMVVWNPIVLLGLHFALNVLGVTQKQAALHEHSKQLHQLHMNMTSLNMTQSLNGSTTEMLANLTSTFWLYSDFCCFCFNNEWVYDQLIDRLLVDMHERLCSLYLWAGMLI